jgi:hypothetical protein
LLLYVINLQTLVFGKYLLTLYKAQIHLETQRCDRDLIGILAVSEQAEDIS